MSDDDFIVASTEYGQVRGRKAISVLSTAYWQFLGIPYAKAPAGRRFQKALKPLPWVGVLDALKEPPRCASLNNHTKQYEGSDDCLYLNVYTKNLRPSKPCAVIVNIFGGGFNTGSSSLDVYSPDYLFAHDVVIVIFNYRLGPLGFLSLNDKSLSVPGNASFNDQQLVLEFVRDNIRNFGGDAGNVTLMGHSSGATSCNFHCIAETSRGLFHRAVILSGSCFASLPQLSWAKRLATALGFEGDTDDESEILKFLEAADCLKMAKAGMKLATEDEKREHDINLPFGPIVEPYVDSSTFLPSPSVDLLKNAWSNDIDVLLGGALDEGMFFKMGRKYDLKFLNEIPRDLSLHLNNERREKLAKEIEEFYISRFADEDKAWEKYFGDTCMWLGLYRFIKARQLSGGKGRTFLYQFAVDSPSQNHYRNRFFGMGSKGVSHADDLCYLWKSKLADVPPKDAMEFRAIETFTSIVMNFISSGKTQWPPIEDNLAKGIIILPDELKIDTIEECTRVSLLWERLYDEAGVKFC